MVAVPGNRLFQLTIRDGFQKLVRFRSIALGPIGTVCRNNWKHPQDSSLLRSRVLCNLPKGEVPA
jgi:hypothetical protein